MLKGMRNEIYKSMIVYFVLQKNLYLPSLQLVLCADSLAANAVLKGAVDLLREKVTGEKGGTQGSEGNRSDEKPSSYSSSSTANKPANMFSFLTLRESTTRPGTIEADLPFSNTPTNNHRLSQSSTTQLFPNDSPPSNAPHTSFGEYIRDWDISTTSSHELFRRCLCFLAFALHIPLNIISVLSYGFSLGLVLGLVFSALNLVCLAFALWKLDVMRGQRLFYRWIYKRHNFDYVILGCTIIYAIAFGILLGARLGLRNWAWYLRVLWPFITVADITCFLFGWIATWRDVTLG